MPQFSQIRETFLAIARQHLQLIAPGNHESMVSTSQLAALTARDVEA